MGAYTCEFGVVHKFCRCPEPHTIKCDKVSEHNMAAEVVATESGKWVFKEENIHKCNKPKWSPGVKRHDRWQCNTCNKVWIVANTYYDQRDNYTGIIWEDYESWKSGPFPPGTK